MLLDYTFITVFAGVTILGITSGVLGVFALLRNHSLLGDAISHAMLPGIVLSFLLTYSKNPFILLFGGVCSGIIGALLIDWIVRKTVIKKDAALGIILAVFFGLGLVFLTMIQKYPVSNQSILHKFLFGNASTLLRSDVYIMGLLACVVLTSIALLWKELVISTFDPIHAKIAGYSLSFIERIFLLLLVCAIAIGLQTMGVVLMSSMIIAPAAAARQWSSRLSTIALLSGFFGAISAMGGAYISVIIQRMPTGPVIVVLLSIFVILSFLIAPHRGIIWPFIRSQKGARE